MKKLVCFDDDSIKHMDLLQALFKMNRSQLIRHLLKSKVDEIAHSQFLASGNGINQSKTEDILKEVVEK